MFSRHKGKIAKVLALIAMLVLVGIDAQEIFRIGSIKNATPIILETSIDILLLVSLYFILRMEISDKEKAKNRLARTLEELKVLNSRLEEANRFKQKSMHMAAHDLRNPIGAIMGYAEILQAHDMIGDNELEIIAKIQEAAVALMALVSDLLESSALEAHALTIKQDVVDLSSVVRKSIDDLEPQASRKRQKIDFSGAFPVQVVGDRGRLQQIVTNLIDNAIKYSPFGRDIRIDLGHDERIARLAIHDKGPGLSELELTEIFKPFSRTKKTPTAGEPSTGLGLSIVKSLVELHGGRIWAESQGLGHGSNFIVELPQA